MASSTEVWTAALYEAGPKKGKPVMDAEDTCEHEPTGSIRGCEWCDASWNSQLINLEVSYARLADLAERRSV